MKLYRIQSLKKESLWYDFDGNFKDKMKQITGQEIPMPFEEWRQLQGKMLSSCAELEQLKLWFDDNLLNKLFNSGYGLFEYDVDKCLHLPKGECVFDYEKANSVKELRMEVLIS